MNHGKFAFDRAFRRPGTRRHTLFEEDREMCFCMFSSTVMRGRRTEFQKACERWQNLHLGLVLLIFELVLVLVLDLFEVAQSRLQDHQPVSSSAVSLLFPSLT